MEAILAQAIKLTAVLRKTVVPWNPEEPHSQPYHTFDTESSSWISKSPAVDVPQDNHTSEITNIALFSWNIDFLLPFAETRMKSALAHLNHLTNPESLSSATAPVIFFQECTSSDLNTIVATPWVRERFQLADVDSTNWATTHYGTTVLLDSRLTITGAFRVHYSKTRMDRDALFIDVSIGPDPRRIRLCNTHLESMAFDPSFRPSQVQVIARHMHENNVHAALAAGDFNAIQPFDRTLHLDNNLKDAFLEQGGKEDTNEGFTWGQQAATNLRKQFGCSRMDKVYFCGDVKLVKFERFGKDVLVEGDDEAKQIVGLGFDKAWITDHLGVMAIVEVVPRTAKDVRLS